MTVARRVLLTGILATLSVALGVACSGADDAGDRATRDAGPYEGGPANDAGNDGPMIGRDGSDEDGPAAPPNAKQVVTGEVFLVGVTSDGYAIYIASLGGDGPLRAVPLAGGAPITLAPDVHFEHVVVKQKGVAFWTNVIGNPLRGTLNVWTQAAGLKASLGKTVANEAYFSDDGKRAAFLVNPRDLAEPPTVDLAVTDVAQISFSPAITAMNMTADMDLAPTCTPHYAFVGKQLFVSHCTLAKARATTLRSISETGVVTTLIDDSALPATRSTFALDSTGARALLTSTDGTLRVTTFATSESVNIDTTVTRAFFARDGANVVYVQETVGPQMTPIFAIRRSPTSAPAPWTVIGNIENVLAVSEDLGAVMFDNNEVAGDDRTDIKLVTTQGPATAIELSALRSAQPVGFTTGGRYAVYLAELSAAGPRIGKLKVHDTTAPVGTSDRVVSTSAHRPTLTTGTKGIYCDNVKVATAVGQRDACDLVAFDATLAAAPAMVASGADPYFVAASGQVAFVLNAGKNRGLYAKALP